MVKPGNPVKVADVPLVVIKQLSLIEVNFTVPQEYLPAVAYQGAIRLRVDATDIEGLIFSVQEIRSSVQIADRPPLTE